MKNGLQIEWTVSAQNQLNFIYDYLETNWTPKEIRNFTKRLDNTLRIIVRFPFIFQASKKKRNNQTLCFI